MTDEMIMRVGELPNGDGVGWTPLKQTDDQKAAGTVSWVRAAPFVSLVGPHSDDAELLDRLTTAIAAAVSGGIYSSPDGLALQSQVAEKVGKPVGDVIAGQIFELTDAVLAERKRRLAGEST